MKKQKYNYSNSLGDLFEAVLKKMKAEREIGGLLKEFKEHESPVSFALVLHKFCLSSGEAEGLINGFMFGGGKKNG
jgi:hypothetical protein